MARTVRHIDHNLLKGHYLAHHRFSDDEFLIDQKTYQYITSFITNFRYSLYTIPDDEKIWCDKILNECLTERVEIQINALMFEANPD
ncbi:MAG: hypothetical protein JXR10_10960 [Cyclobacteriaceae bacterium]